MSGVRRTVWFTYADLKALRQIANFNGVTEGHVVRVAIRSYLEQPAPLLAKPTEWGEVNHFVGKTDRVGRSESL